MNLSRLVPPPVSGKNVLCLAVDRLNADFLGAFGNGWIETTSFDALAAESIVFDSFFATSLDLETLYRAFWRGENPTRIDAANFDDDSNAKTAPGAAVKLDANVPNASLFRILKEKGYRTFVVSDVESVALHPAIDDDFCDGRFYLDAPDAELPAETLEETRFFRNFEELARFLARLEDDAKTAEKAGKTAPPWFVWAHFSGWADRWDFPLENRERFREDEDDPEPYSATLVPFWRRDDETAKKRGAAAFDDEISPENLPETADFDASDDFDDETAPEPGEIERQLAALEFARLAQLDAPERRQSVVEAYSGGVAAFDGTLEGFVQLLKESGVLDKTLFLTLGTRGFSTGSPGALGVEPEPDSASAEIFAPDAPVDADDSANFAQTPQNAALSAPFYSEETRLPLTIRLPNGVGATVRLPALCEPRDVFETLRRWPDFADELATPEFWAFDAVEISPFSGRWSAENPAATAENEPSPESETVADFDAAAPDVPGQNLLRLLANEDGAVRDRVTIVKRDANSLERALVVADWILKATPRPKNVDDFSDETSPDAAFETADSAPFATKLELFVRPDDRYCVNDVANRCVEIVEKLAPALQND